MREDEDGALTFLPKCAELADEDFHQVFERNGVLGGFVLPQLRHRRLGISWPGSRGKREVPDTYDTVPIWKVDSLRTRALTRHVCESKATLIAKAAAIKMAQPYRTTG